MCALEKRSLVQRLLRRALRFMKFANQSPNLIGFVGDAGPSFFPQRIVFKDCKQSTSATRARKVACHNNPSATKNKQIIQCEQAEDGARAHHKNSRPPQRHSLPATGENHDGATIRFQKFANVLMHLCFHVTPRPATFAGRIGRVRAACIRFAILDESRCAQATINSPPMLLPCAGAEQIRAQTLEHVGDAGKTMSTSRGHKTIRQARARARVGKAIPMNVRTLARAT